MSNATVHAQDFDRETKTVVGPTVFYLHGRIIEDGDTQPVHPSWGVYDYPAVVEALGSRGANVVSEARSGGTNVFEYAGELIRDIEDAISEGVPPSQIIVVGFSKGGVISIFVSSFLGRPEIRYVFLAACGEWTTSYPHLRLTGHVLSIFEESDDLAGSCSDFAARSGTANSFDEVQIATGKEHGAFYTPKSEWLDVVLDWVHHNDT